LVPHLLLLYVGLKWFGLMGGATALLLVTIMDLLLMSVFSGFRMWELKAFWIGCGFASVAYVTSTLAFRSTTGVVLSIIEVIAVTAWSLFSSKDLQMVIGSLRTRVGLASRRGAT
jgi:hypothetical protein